MIYKQHKSKLKKELYLEVVLVLNAKKLEKLTGENDDEQTGINIIERAIEEPLRQIVVLEWRVL